MKVSNNAYYHWLKNKGVKRQKASLVYLKERISMLFDQSKQIYGSKRIKKALEREGLYYSVSYVASLMRELGLKSVLKKKYIATTDSKHDLKVADNKLNREFISSKLGEKWVSDITYIKVGSSWNYLTTIMDLADRKIVSWVVSQDMTTENTVLKAWKKAIKTRQITDDHIFHSDRGVQYASRQMQQYFNNPIKNQSQSMSRKGNCWDNAVAESFFKTIKYECLNRYKFSNYIEVYSCIDEYINWYNYQRLHSSLDYLTPAEMELKIKIKQLNNVA